MSEKFFVAELPKQGDIVRNTKKDTIYKIFGISRHTETQEPCIVYYNINGEIYHRPINEFVGYRWSDELGDWVPRFELLKEKDWEQAIRAEAERREYAKKCERLVQECYTRYRDKTPWWRRGYIAAINAVDLLNIPPDGLAEFSKGEKQAREDLKA